MTPARIIVTLSLTCFASLAPVACTREAPEQGTPSPAASRRAIPLVYAVNYPLSYFAERIGGEHVEVVFPAIEGDPAHWRPDAEAIRSFQSADLVLLNGAGYAGWVSRATLAESTLVDTSKAFRDRLIALDDAVTHSHGPEGEHEHAGTAFTTWLDLSLAVEHCRAIRDAFTKLKPDRADDFEKALRALEADLVALDERIRAIVARKPAQPLVVSHPVYQYFTRRYGLDVESVHWEPDAMPDAAGWAELEQLLASHPARWMIWEGQPSQEVVTRLEKLGVKSLVFDPCGNRPEELDLLGVLERNVANLEAAF